MRKSIGMVLETYKVLSYRKADKLTNDKYIIIE